MPVNVPHETCSKMSVNFTHGDSVAMRWQEIRKQYPDQWLLIEAISAQTVAEQRVLNDIAVVDTFTDSAAAL